MKQNNSNGFLPVITGLLIIEVQKSNPNGDPDNDGAPRIRPDGKGEISSVSLKRKHRDLVSDKEGPVWQSVQDELGLDVDNFDILEDRGRDRAAIVAMLKDNVAGFTAKYHDGRLFGNCFLEEGGPDTTRCGALQLGVGISIAPIDVEFGTWTNKSGVEADKDRGLAPNAQKLVAHGLYAMPFFVNPTAGRKSGCTLADINVFLSLIKHVYPHTRSVNRTMVEVIHAHTFTHNRPCGSCNPLSLIRALSPAKLGDPSQPSTSLADYSIPQWNDVSETYSARGTYVDHAQF